MSSHGNDIPEGFKMTELGPLPEGWETTRLGDLFEIRQGKALSPEHRRGISPGLFLRTANVFWGRLDLVNLDSMDFTGNEVSQLKLMPNDLLVCEGGDIGRTALWRGELNVCCYQNHLHRLRTVRDDVHPLFYMYWMQAAYLLLDLYGGTGNKTTIPNLSQSRLRAFVLPFPPLAEQKAIVRVLSAIQEAIEAQDKITAAARELKKSLMHHLFTYGPVPVAEAERVLLKETEIGLVPEHWEVVRLGEVADNLLGGGTPSTSRPDYWDGAIHWTTSKRITGLHISSGERGITQRGLEESSTHLIPKGNLLIGTRVGVGKVAVTDVDIAISQDLTGMFVDQSKYDLEFLAYEISSSGVQECFRNSMRGTTIKGIPREDLKNIQLSIPSLIEQKRIAHMVSTADEEVVSEQNRKTALQSLFQTMLHHLMTGKVRVKEMEAQVS